MLRTARRTGRRLAILATLTGALAAASCTPSRSAEPDTSTDPTAAGPGETSAVGSSPPDSAGATPTTTPAPTTEPAPSTTARPTITPAMWEAFGDQLAVRLMGAGDYAASYAVAVDGDVVYTDAVGPRVPVPVSPDLATDPAATTTSSTTAPSTTTSTSTTTSSTTTTSSPGATTSTAPRPTTTARPTTTSTRGPIGRVTSTTTSSTTVPRTTVARTTVVSTTAAAPRSTTTSTTAAPRRVEEAEPTDRFRIASISKVITATVVLQLVEDGLVELDDPVLQPLIDELDVTIVDPAMREVTLRQLLSHTSGFQVHQSTFFGGGTASCRAAAARGLTSYLEAPPGTSYRYSNMNFCLLGLLVEHLTGDTYEDAATERLLEPLGIEGMRLAGTFDARPDEVQHPSVPTRNYMEALGAAGAWVASAEDVVRIVDALDPSKPGWHPLPDDVLRYMRLASAGVTYNNIADRWYGLGLIVWADGSWGHTGTVENTHAMVLNRPDGITWSILVNGEYPSETDRLRRIFDDAAEAAGLPIAPAGG